MNAKQILIVVLCFFSFNNIESGFIKTGILGAAGYTAVRFVQADCNLAETRKLILRDKQTVENYFNSIEEDKLQKDIDCAKKAAAIKMKKLIEYIQSFK